MRPNFITLSGWKSVRSWFKACSKLVRSWSPTSFEPDSVMEFGLAASDHIRRVVSESAQTLYALRVLRHHGLSDVGLQELTGSVPGSCSVKTDVYASTAWRRFVTASDIQRVDAFLRRSLYCSFCPSHLPDFCEQLAECDDRLFNGIRNNPQHPAQPCIPPPSTASQNYDLRPRRAGEGKGGSEGCPSPPLPSS